MPSTRLLLMLCFVMTARCALQLRDTKPSTTPPYVSPEIHADSSVIDPENEDEWSPDQLVHEEDSAGLLDEEHQDYENAGPQQKNTTPPPPSTSAPPGVP